MIYIGRLFFTFSKTFLVVTLFAALSVAFELLHNSFNDPEVGANCNQAIMLVTDGVPYKSVP
jgi:hypothetical protein